MAHGYYNLKGDFVTTATKAAATAAWREERGYNPIGVFDVGGGEVVDTRKEQPSGPAPTPIAATPTEQAATNLAQTFTGETDVQRNARLQAAFDAASTSVVPTTDALVRATSGYGITTTPELSKQAEIEARSGYTLDDPARQRIEQRGGYDLYIPPEPQLQTGFRELDTNLYGQQGAGEAALAAAQQTYLAPAQPAPTPAPLQPPQYTGRQYYQGGSEQAYLGPVAQAEEYFFGTGDRWGLGSSYIDIAPEDRKPPPILNQATVRILTKSGPSYLEGVDYGPSMTMQDIERIYEYDPVTGHYLLKGAEPALSAYYSSSGQGYASAGPGYGTGYGYGSRGGQIGGGLVSWRIGF